MTVPRSCRAAALVAHGKPLEIVEVPVPPELEPGAVLVRTLAATVCATDVRLREGGVASDKAAATLPVILGHEMVGEVVRLAGNDRDSLGRPLAEGDRIVWTPGNCGQCPSCVVEQTPTLCENRRGYMSASPDTYPHLTGGFAEYGYVYPTSGRVKVPDTVPDDVAAASSCALTTMVNAFDQLGRLEVRHTVVIQGSGPLGLFATAMATMTGPQRVIVVGGPADRLDLARHWGADDTVDVTTVPAEERLDQVMALTAGRGADVVIEVSGVAPAFTEGVAMLRQGGRYLVVGQIHGQEVPFNPSAIVMKQARLIGSFSGAVNHYARALSFLDRHSARFSWTDMITSHGPLEDINQAFQRMRDHKDIKPAIIFD